MKIKHRSRPKLNQWTPNHIRRMLSNPFYCIQIHPDLCVEHELLISEEDFIKAGVESIRQEGAEVYLRHLLENLKGNYVTGGNEDLTPEALPAP